MNKSERGQLALQANLARVEAGEKWKRGNDDEQPVNDSEYQRILERFDSYDPSYRENREVLRKRDIALVSFLIDTGFRITEGLGVKRLQYFTEPVLEWRGKIMEDCHSILNVEPEKQRGKTKKVRPRVPLLRTGPLAPFTKIVESWIESIGDSESFLYPRGYGAVWDAKREREPLKRSRAYQIVSEITEKYPHYCRRLCASYWGRLLNPFELKAFFAWAKVASGEPYVGLAWEQAPALLKRV